MKVCHDSRFDRERKDNQNFLSSSFSTRAPRVFTIRAKKLSELKIAMTQVLTRNLRKKINIKNKKDLLERPTTKRPSCVY